MKVGLDFDGVITKYPVMFSKLSKNAEFDCYVITARPHSHREFVEGFLKNYDIDVKQVLMIEQDLNKSHDAVYIETVIKEKSKMINTLKIETYYEDDLRILHKIKEEFPSISTVLVL